MTKKIVERDVKHQHKQFFCLIFRAKQILFTIDVATTRTRTAEYRAEMDYIYNQLQDEIRRSVSSRVSVCRCCVYGNRELCVPGSKSRKHM